MMQKRSTLFLVTGLAAFVLVLGGAVTFSLAIKLIQPQDSQATAEWVTSAIGTQGTLTDAGLNDPAANPDAVGGIAATAQPEMISPERANILALAFQPGQLSQSAPELVNYQGQMAYQVRVGSNLVYIAAFSGNVLGQQGAMGGAETVQAPASVNQQNSSESYEDDDHDSEHKDHDDDDDDEDHEDDNN